MRNNTNNPSELLCKSVFFTISVNFILILCTCSSFGNELKVASQPTVASLSPASGQAGNIISINGANFDAFSIAIFQSAILNQVVTVTASTIETDLIVLSVPANIKSGIITILGASGTAQSPSAFTYLRKSQSILGINAGINEGKYGMEVYSISGSNTENSVTLTSISIPSSGVVTIVGKTVKVIGVGLATITGQINSNANYEAVTIQSFLNITPALISIVPISLTKVFGSANPILSSNILGIQNNDGLNIQFYTLAEKTSSTGEYAVYVSITGLAAANYQFSTIAGILSITKASQVISFPTIPGYKLASTIGYLTLLGIKASSGLPVNISVSGKARLQSFEDQVAVLEIFGAGLVLVSGSQTGNQNYNAAPEVFRTIEITSTIKDSLVVSAHQSLTENDIAVFPNPNEGNFTIKGDFTMAVRAFTTSGIEQPLLQGINSNQFSIDTKGLHYLSITNGQWHRVVKMVVE